MGKSATSLALHEFYFILYTWHLFNPPTYYRRQITPDEVHTILQSHVEGSSLRGIARIVKRSYRTVINLVKMASQKAQLIHNQAVQSVETEAIIGDELWSFVKKNRNSVYRKS